MGGFRIEAQGHGLAATLRRRWNNITLPGGVKDYPVSPFNAFRHDVELGRAAVWVSGWQQLWDG